MMKSNFYYKLATEAKTEKLSNTRTRYHISDNFIIDITVCPHDLKNPRDIMNLWKKAGHIEKALQTHLSVETYFTDINGQCWGIYNITHTRDHRRINFDYIREATKENELELVAECIRLCEMDIA